MRISDWSSDVCSSDLSFAADHMGLSSWRGKFNRTTGSVTLDPEAGTGTVEVKIDLASIDFGHAKLNHWATGEKFFAVAKSPEATRSEKRRAGKELVSTCRSRRWPE